MKLNYCCLPALLAVALIAMTSHVTSFEDQQQYIFQEIMYEANIFDNNSIEIDFYESKLHEMHRWEIDKMGESKRLIDACIHIMQSLYSQQSVNNEQQIRNTLFSLENKLINAHQLLSEIELAVVKQTPTETRKWDASARNLDAVLCSRQVWPILKANGVLKVFVHPELSDMTLVVYFLTIGHVPSDNMMDFIKFPHYVTLRTVPYLQTVIIE